MINRYLRASSMRLGGLSIALWVIFSGFPFSQNAVAQTSGIDRISGRYEYVRYVFLTPDGFQGNLSDLGASEAVLEISPDMSMKLLLKMANGSTKVERAHISYLQVMGDHGYWLAKWKDVSGFVRGEFELGDDTIDYVVDFTDQNGLDRVGMQERATLKRIMD
ncbi:hypothetical protein [Luteimonas salinilitoris]|uniref:Uncharacterized protein n=1 Tax=Luteimonas salinilitoris TaxID=3237697 RepID=A0ABV4HPT5_9GAMM